MSKKYILTKKEIGHWLGHNFMNGNSEDCVDWLPDLIGRLANKELTVEEIVEEIKGMYKHYMLDKDFIEVKENEDDN
tara:strand:+ start:198 stop:428 length:231 start_codon:yes stop_codon:yes gene_type:complete